MSPQVPHLMLPGQRLKVGSREQPPEQRPSRAMRIRLRERERLRQVGGLCVEVRSLLLGAAHQRGACSVDAFQLG